LNNAFSRALVEACSGFVVFGRVSDAPTAVGAEQGLVEHDAATAVHRGCMVLPLQKTYGDSRVWIRGYLGYLQNNRRDSFQGFLVTV
jgi:hypothetical protein